MSEVELEGKKRCRTTKKQIITIVNYLEAHSFMLQPTERNNNMFAKLQASWEELSSLLNNMEGPSKTIAQWKMVISELKTNVKKKARKIYIEQQRTGGGPPPKPLTDIDEKLYTLISKVAVEGAKEVPEVGLDEDIELPFEEEVLIEVQEMDQLHSLMSDTVEVDNVVEITSEKPIIDITAQQKHNKKYKETKATSLQTAVHEETTALTELAKSVNTLAESIKLLAIAVTNINKK